MKLLETDIAKKAMDMLENGVTTFLKVVQEREVMIDRVMRLLDENTQLRKRVQELNAGLYEKELKLDEALEQIEALTDE